MFLDFDRIKISTVIVLLMFIGMANSLSAQQYDSYTQVFRGVVKDAQTEMPLPGATVMILGSDPVKGTATDTSGRFRMENLPLGRMDIQVSMVGYMPRVLRNLLLVSGRELVLEINMDEHMIELEEVVVRPEHRKDQPMHEMALVSARSFSVEETERYAGSLGDPSRMAANFAGVSAPSDQRNDIIIRGNSPLGLLFRLEGIDVPNPNHFGSMGSAGGPVSMLNNNLLTNSDFFTGAFPAEFGNALAGAFDLRMRNGNNEKYEFMGQVGFNGFELGAEGPFSPGSQSSFLINFRYSTLEVLQKMGMSFGTGTAVPEYHDLSFKFNFPTQNGRITLFGLGGSSQIAMLDSEDDDAQFGFSGTDLYFGVRTGVLGLTHVRFFSEDARLTTNLAVTGIENNTDIIDLSISNAFVALVERDHEVKYSLSSKYNHRLNARNYIQAGAVVDLFNVKYIGEGYDEDWEDFFYYMNTTGHMGLVRGFGEWQHRVNQQLTINAGLHASYLLYNNTGAVEPRLALKWAFRENQSLALGAGLHSQMQMKAVYLMEEVVDRENHVYQKTNEDLDFSKSFHLVASYDRLLGEGHRLKTEVYYQRLYNIPVSHRRPEFSLISQGGGFAFWTFHDMVNQGSGENKGVEITLEKFLQEGFYYLFTASLFDAGYRGYDGVWRNSAFNNNYVLNALGGYEWKVGNHSLLGLDLNAVWSGGVPYLPIDVQESVEEGRVRFKWDEVYEERHPDYFRLNARITFRLNGQKVSQEWGLDLQNLTGRQNVYTQNWDNHKQEISTAHQMGFMPMMTYRIYF